MHNGEMQSEGSDTFFEKPPNTALCKNCHGEIKPKHARFCLNCGTKVGESFRIQYVQEGWFAGLPRIEGWLIGVGMFLCLVLFMDIAAHAYLFSEDIFAYSFAVRDTLSFGMLLLFDFCAIYLFVRRSEFFPTFFFIVTGYKTFLFISVIVQNRGLPESSENLTALCECLLYIYLGFCIKMSARSKMTFTQPLSKTA